MGKPLGIHMLFGVLGDLARLVAGELTRQFALGIDSLLTRWLLCLVSLDACPWSRPQAVPYALPLNRCIAC